MEENREPSAVPYIVHEGAMVKLERSNRRLMIAIIVVVIALVINNIAWILFENHRQNISNEQFREIIQQEQNADE